MGTQFISLLPPPGKDLSEYKPSALWNAQPSSISKTFIEAMSVRYEVFVKEQKVPLENELDSDDARSWHWVVYASIGGVAPPPPEQNGKNDHRKSPSNSLAVGTIRLVPPPHPPHPSPTGDNADAAEDEVISIYPNQPMKVKTRSTENPNNEPYVKIGRLATLKEFRKLGLSKLLMNEAMKWASDHPDDILPPQKAAEVEAARINDLEPLPKWQGLILVHAQTYLEKYYHKLGFVKDEGLGEWDEEGIMHIGMWKRVPVRRKSIREV